MHNKLLNICCLIIYATGLNININRLY